MFRHNVFFTIMLRNFTLRIFIYSCIISRLTTLLGRQVRWSPHYRWGITKNVFWKRAIDRTTDTTKTINSAACIRGGSINNNNDEERYSRQVYTLGEQAHTLIRSATVYIDGPPQSGLVYECAKNLALSGTRHIIIVTNDVDNRIERRYHDAELDDLGQAYQRSAIAEIFGDEVSHNASDTTLLMEYIRRLNPSVIVSQVSRSTLTNVCNSDGDDAKNSVMLCIDRPIPTAISLNRVARQQRWAFVATETAGVFGIVFCDFGEEFIVNDTDGETPIATPLDRIECNGDDGDAVVIHCVNGERHDVSKGDMIRFQYRNGTLSEDNGLVIDVQSPYRFIARLVTLETNSVPRAVTNINHHASSFCRVKLPKSLKFEDLNSALKLATDNESMFTPCDLDKSYDTSRRWASMSCFHALSKFVEEKERYPTGADQETFFLMIQNVWPSTDFDINAVDHSLSFLRTCGGKFAPLQSVFGAISAQEVLKAITKIYHPIHQFLLYDCDEVLKSNKDSSSIITISSSLEKDAPGLRYILGDDIVNKLQSTTIFVVGAGAIGCEIIKNLAAMGSGTKGNGKIILTDMDTIEKSNLSRQLLFRDNDIGKFKSAAAYEAALRLNRSMRIRPHSCKVGEVADNSPFDETFWSNELEIVLNALDNVDARLYIDKKCVTNKKALIDAGTMGAKGNIQVIVPHQSESYASSVDPPEPSIPVCTLKNFPYTISHTIQWGRDLFEGLFQRQPEQANDFLEKLKSTDVEGPSMQFIQERGTASAIEISQELLEDLSNLNLSNDEDLLKLKKNFIYWTIDLAVKLFYLEPMELLTKHPLESTDDEGLPFWSGSRRPPKSITFDVASTESDQLIVNENFIEFVRHGARLRFESFICNQRNKSTRSSLILTPLEAQEACVEYFHQYSGVSRNEDKSGINGTLQSLKNYDDTEQRMVPIDFEKDDELNGHVAFVNAASNLRAIVYGIPTVDFMETRRVAGKIIPAMISTTAFVSALSTIELVKLVQNAELKHHRNAFINLALPFFAFTMPLPAEKIPGLDGQQYTLWSELSIRESEDEALMGGITMKSLLKQIKKLSSTNPSTVDVVSISFGPYLLYANFMHENDDDLLRSSLWEQIDEAVASSGIFDEENSRVSGDTGMHFDLNHSFVDLTVVVVDVETVDEVELPPVRVCRFQL
jgi:ubiquitin-activating enzyme E1